MRFVFCNTCRPVKVIILLSRYFSIAVRRVQVVSRNSLSHSISLYIILYYIILSCSCLYILIKRWRAEREAAAAVEENVRERSPRPLRNGRRRNRRKFLHARFISGRRRRRNSTKSFSASPKHVCTKIEYLHFPAKFATAKCKNPKIIIIKNNSVIGTTKSTTYYVPFAASQ